MLDTNYCTDITQLLSSKYSNKDIWLLWQRFDNTALNVLEHRVRILVCVDTYDRSVELLQLRNVGTIIFQFFLHIFLKILRIYFTATVNLTVWCWFVDGMISRKEKDDKRIALQNLVLLISQDNNYCDFLYLWVAKTILIFFF